MPHSDDSAGRTVAFVWHLSRNWDPEWGGSLFWQAEPSGRAYIPASYNTLHLFSVTRQSDHFVTPVSAYAEEERLAFNGWFTRTDRKLSESALHELPKKYPRFEDRLLLSSTEVEELLEIDASKVDNEFHHWQYTLYQESASVLNPRSSVIDLGFDDSPLDTPEPLVERTIGIS